MRAGQIVRVRHKAPFELVFALPEFEHRSLERETGVSRSGATCWAVEVRYRLTN